MYLKLAFLSLWRRPFRQGIVLVLIALATALPVFLLQMTGGLYRGINRAVEPFPVLAGAKGSAYQLVLNTVFLKDRPLENISYETVDKLRKSGKAKAVYPLAFGDNYRGFPIIGVEKEIFQYKPNRKKDPWLTVKTGKSFSEKREVVLGSEAARLSGLRIGDTFHSIHGMAAAGKKHGEENKVAGILAPCGGPYDAAIFIDIRDVWEAHHIPAWEQKGDVTAVLIQPEGYKEALQLLAAYQRNKEIQLLFPSQPVISLYHTVGQSKEFWKILISFLLILSLLMTLLIMYWSGKSRIREFALLKALGAGGGDIIKMLLGEQALLLLTGSAAGWACAWVTVYLTASVIAQKTAIVIDTTPLWEGLLIIPGITILGTVAGLIPAKLIKNKELSSYL